MSNEENVVEAAAPAARIVLKRSGVETDVSFPINPPTVIGRFDPAVGPVDVDLGELDEGKYVSRKHAKIVFENGAFKLIDLGSSNGSFILRDDFERVQEAELAPGAEFALGNARFVFKVESPEPAAASEPEQKAEEPAEAQAAEPDFRTEA